MSEQAPISPEKRSEYHEVARDLQDYQGFASRHAYTPEFLAKYEADHPEDYAELKKLIAYANPKDENPVLKEAVKGINLVIDSFLIEKELQGILEENDFDPAACRLNITNGNLVEIHLPCVGEPLVIKSLSLGDNIHTNDEWMLEGVTYTPGLSYGAWGTLEEVLEDAWDIKTALAKVQEGAWTSNSEDPFQINPLNQLTFEGHGVISFNTSEANDSAAMEKVLNRRYHALFDKEPTVTTAALPAETEEVTPVSTEKVRETYAAEIKPFYEMDLEIPVSELVPLALKVVPNYRNTAMNVMAVKLQELNKDFEALPSYTDKSILDSYEEQMRKQCAGIFMIKDSIDSRSTPEAEEEGGTLASATLAAPSAPVEAENPAPKTEAEFVAMLHENGNRAKYMTESTVGEDTEVTIHLPTKNDVVLSRIQHFVGDDSAMMGLSDVSKYQLLVSEGKQAGTYEWKDGTWKDSSKSGEPRLLIYDGTRYKIHKKEGSRVTVAEPAPVEPVPVASSAAPEAVVAKEYLSESDLGIVALQLKNDNAVLEKGKARKEEAEGKLAKEPLFKGRWTKQAEEAQALIVEFTKEVEKGKRVILENKDSPAYAVVMGSEDYKDTRVALGLPEPISSTLATNPEEPAETLTYLDGSKFVGTFTEAGVPLKGTYTNVGGESVEVHLDPANLEAPFNMTVGGETVAMRWDDGDVPGAGGFIRADMGLPAEGDASADVEPETPPARTES